MRLEYESPEETKIRELEHQINEAGDKGEPVESLREERRRTYDLWIERLDREINNAKGERDRGRLERQRERAIREYGYQ